MILTMPFNRSVKVKFDCISGGKSIVADNTPPVGVLHCQDSHTFALYSQRGLLKLQINTKVWDMTSKSMKISFHHNIANRTSIFSVISADDNFIFEYPAWWSSIPNFSPVEPEMDQDEDFLAYIYAVWQSPSIQQSLLNKWK